MLWECVVFFGSVSISQRMIDRLDLTGAIEYSTVSFNLMLFLTLFTQMIMYINVVVEPDAIRFFILQSH